MASLRITGGPRIYNLFVLLAGPVQRWHEHLERIARMRFDWVYVNPFHAPGFSGSIYAVKDYRTLNPMLRGYASARDDDLLRDFVVAARRHGLRVMMDFVVNHTSRDARLVDEHPDWYARGDDGDVRSPVAVDPDDARKRTVWGDLAELDWSPRPEREAMLTYFATIGRTYAGLGFRGFRCDAAYKMPADVWAALRNEVRASAPDAIFVAENLGARPEEVERLAGAGFDYLFNSSKWWDFRAPWLLEQYETFRHIAPSIAFPESHDTPRLASELESLTSEQVAAAYRLRYLFAAFFSAGVMLPMGYEFGFGKKLDVVLTRPKDWEQARFDLTEFIAGVNAMKAAIPALNTDGPQERITPPERPELVLVRHATAGASAAVAALNPSANAAALISASEILTAFEGATAHDVTPERLPLALEPGSHVTLAPLEMRVFATAQAGVAATSHGPVAIENVWPEIDAGRFPVKRIVGDEFVVEADIFRDGHDVVAAVLRYRERDAGDWNETPMHLFDNDRWRGSFRLERNATYEYTLEAWPEAFASWQNDARKKHAAGQDVALDIDEGLALVREAARRGAGAGLATLLHAVESADALTARTTLLGDDVRSAMAAATDRARATHYPRTLEVIVDRAAARFAAWYELFPRSQGTVPGRASTLREAQARIPDIKAMGFDVIYFPPIHPIGLAARKGPNNSLNAGPADPGSPYAIGSAHGGHTAIEPGLGTLDDFAHFVDAAREAGLELALDYALQCSPDHPYVREHPEWFTFRPDGTIKHAENPPKKYQDIVNFNFWGPHAAALWTELRDVVLFWAERRVRIFRVDNPHTKPFPFWEWMIGEVRRRHPDTIFLSEAFTRPKVMKYLAKAGFTQSYTYFTWRNDRPELESYLRELANTEMAEYYRPNFFTNTPDILPGFLQTGGRAAFLIRHALAATLSGAYGMYSGFELCENAALPNSEEYLDSEKYEIRVRDWNAPGNIKAEITALNAVRREHPALQDWRNVEFHDSDDPSVIFYSKVTGSDAVLVAVNLDPFAAHRSRVRVPLERLGYAPGDRFAVRDLLTGSRAFWRGATKTLELPAASPVALFHIEARTGVRDEPTGT